MKDLMTVVSATLLGLVAFVVYLLYATRFLFFVALAYLTYSFFKDGLIKHNKVQQPPTMHMDDARVPLS